MPYNFSYDYDDYYAENFTTEESHDDKPTYDFRAFARILTVIVYSVTCLLGLLGNGLVIAVITFKMKKSVNAIWFLNLAAADFLFNVFLPLTITYTAMDYHWVFGRAMCKINSMVLILNMYTSVFLLTIISIDRCLLVVFPVWSQNHRNPKMACLLCVFIWALGFLMSSPSLVFRDTTMHRNLQTHEYIVSCFNNYSLSNSQFHHQGEMAQTVVTIVRFLVGFVVPMSIITICYATILCRLQRSRFAKSKKLLKIIIIIITTFFLCWCPYHVFHLLEIQHRKFPRQLFAIGMPLVTAVAVSNSCMNPVLYVFIGQDFKKFKLSILYRLVNALSEDSTRSTISRRNTGKISSVTEKESILL
ncbi:chemerin-like receptor 1 [Hemicordylus capensis]|uniref:chemerin-like receptor 1 n=1 Tax=Hemicordylus capensis TaxID=884348 RepID=UPI00230409B9|nr:chemerin-like receptor 1 [Hemicordylus capensis]XP_053136377.1 chemerin-like receptor 1 [Hemicordylus capensis]XP_053136378.1 chemerin-like receptor 1 [Hemicordylus capensis]XP_053136379.1 chemerin-like receptor 1 [Hemicordylus capensis]XP_053136380.1 chemerin-like receptor 1 [Hemicordylus capensis]XP_053136381.1 chemerin-like receptor 1 [Hemicordylus capensis]XP_053136382.1 chemerin-like receptor 1 [Hemicordylus capensis]XP_053136383.1 chemerin-like receptor 1 [Hemicordylus capensis]XP_